MSRSFRKNPYVTDQQGSRSGRAPTTPSRVKRAKRAAARAVRDTDEVPSGGSFKKFSCSWDIRDYGWFDPEYKKARRK